MAGELFLSEATLHFLRLAGGKEPGDLQPGSRAQRAHQGLGFRVSHIL